MTLLTINNSRGEIRWNGLKKITLVEGEGIINEDGENAEILNTFFSNAVKNLKIPEYQETDSLATNISHPIFKAILKYRNNPKNLNKGSIPKPKGAICLIFEIKQKVSN